MGFLLRLEYVMEKYNAYRQNLQHAIEQQIQVYHDLLRLVD
jgi:hypothetical protein